MKPEKTTIQISKKLLQEIKEMGFMGETYEDVITRLIEWARKQNELR